MAAHPHDLLSAFDAATTCSLSVSAHAGEGAGPPTGYAGVAGRSPEQIRELATLV